MEILRGRIESIGPEGILIRVPAFNAERACVRKYDRVEVGFPDGRSISPAQRAKAYAMLNDISEWAGHTPDFIKRFMKLDFITKRMEALVKHTFSLSTCDVTTAREFISFLIEFCIEHGVPCKLPLYEQAEDIQRYVYACLKFKRCAICGSERPDLHHWDAIGRRKRDEIPQIGWPVISLCRLHHQEAESLGKVVFAERYHLEPVALTIELAKIYKLTKKNMKEISNGKDHQGAGAGDAAGEQEERAGDDL
jgi:hypothetical protein